MTASNAHRWAALPDPSAVDLARAIAGDAEAFRLIVERYQGMVYSVAYNVLCNPSDAEDAAQEAFLRCYRKLPQYRSEASFGTWLFRVSLSAAIDYQRRERRRPEPVEAPEIADVATPALGDGITTSMLVEALGDLPDDYRVPTVLRDIYGLPYQEIAELTRRPIGTVKVMVHRGRSSLRLRLRRDCMAASPAAEARSDRPSAGGRGGDA